MNVDLLTPTDVWAISLSFPPVPRKASSSTFAPFADGGGLSVPVTLSLPFLTVTFEKLTALDEGRPVNWTEADAPGDRMSPYCGLRVVFST